MTKEELSIKQKKTLFILNVVTICIAIFIIVGGIVADIVCWGYIFPAIRDPNEPGHGMPVFSFFGFMLSIIFLVITRIVLIIVRFMQHKAMKRIIEQEK